MSDVDLLPEAAAKMRQRVRDAEKARHASTWQIEFPPAVALAVANWLEAEADLIAVWRERRAVSTWAMAVAREFLDGAK